MNDNFDPVDVLVPSAMTGQDGDLLYYRSEAVSRILHAASLPAIPLPDDIQGDPEKISAYFMAKVAEIPNANCTENMLDGTVVAISDED